MSKSKKSFTDVDVVACINKLSSLCYSSAYRNGFWFESETIRHDKYYLCTKLALVAAEVSEAIETIRYFGKVHVPPGISEFSMELADIVIRVFDIAGALDIDLGDSIIGKMRKNAQRPYKHGKHF